MFKQIKTSRENKEVVSRLTKKLNLGKENVIARIAFMYSLSLNRKFDINKIEDSGGKEYSRSVLFGDYFDIYIALICTHYGLYNEDASISRYVKVHVDDGLQLLNDEVNNGNDIPLLINKLNLGLQELKTLS